jgi:hypothetical protein
MSLSTGNRWKKGIHFAGGGNVLYRAYHNNQGFEELAAFISNRYFAIETRVYETFRFVDLAPGNALTFSYEFASLLRDIGSALDSALKVFGRNVTAVRNPTIHDHLDFLRQNLHSKSPGEPADLTTISVELASNRTDRFLFPLADTCSGSTTDLPQWWGAYNAVKHQEIEKLEEGNLKNVLNAFAALFALFVLTDKEGGLGYPYKVLVEVKFDRAPTEWDESLRFFKGR